MEGRDREEHSSLLQDDSWEGLLLLVFYSELNHVRLSKWNGGWKSFYLGNGAWLKTGMLLSLEKGKKRFEGATDQFSHITHSKRPSTKNALSKVCACLLKYSQLGPSPAISPTLGTGGTEYPVASMPGMMCSPGNWFILVMSIYLY